MDRRNFIGLGLGVLAVSVLPSNLAAINFRETKPKVWQEKTTSGALKELYGTDKLIKEKVTLKAPDIAENGAVIPLTVSSDLNGKTVSVFQNSNPESAVAVFTVPEGGIINYSFRIKMAKTGVVTAVVEADDGKLYADEKTVKVTIGGCGG